MGLNVSDAYRLAQLAGLLRKEQPTSLCILGISRLNQLFQVPVANRLISLETRTWTGIKVYMGRRTVRGSLRLNFLN